MDILGFLKEKKGESIIDAHPFAYYNHAFKYLYCFGLGVLACGHMKAMTETKRVFDEILENIKLHPNDRDRIVIDINNNFDYKITEVFKILDTKEKQYMFTVDLLKLSSATLWAQVYSENVTNIFMSVFQLAQIERKFLEDFLYASRKKNLKESKRFYHEFIKAGYQVEYSLLKYMYPDFQIEETYYDLILEKGESLTIDKPTLIHGKLVVRNGSSLCINGADVRLEGSIHVEEGRITIKKSNFFVKDISQPFLFNIKDCALVKIEDSIIDCNMKCGMLRQENGILIINNSKIIQTKVERAIVFSGKSFIMNGTKVEDAYSGGIQTLDKTLVNIDDCRFNHCEAEHGGAIYFNSLSDTRISNCNFKNCVAKYIAGAVYFTSKKYGQTLYSCEFENCIPKDSVVFNDYKSENNTFHKEE